MGNSVLSRFRSEEDITIVFLGLYDSGKTTTLYKLNLGELTTTIPAFGFEVETLSHKNVSIVAMDVGGRNPVRPLLRHYYRLADGLIFMIDSSDLERLDHALKELTTALNEEELKGVPVVILASKQDLPKSLPLQDIVSRLHEIKPLREHEWIVFGVSMTDGQTGDIYEGLEWLKQNILTRRKLKINSFRTDSSAKIVPTKYLVNSDKAKDKPHTIASKVVESFKSFIVR